MMHVRMPCTALDVSKLSTAVIICPSRGLSPTCSNDSTGGALETVGSGGMSLLDSPAHVGGMTAAGGGRSSSPGGSVASSVDVAMFEARIANKFGRGLGHRSSVTSCESLGWVI